MTTMVEEVTPKIEMLEVEPHSKVAPKAELVMDAKMENEPIAAEAKEKVKAEKVILENEPNLEEKPIAENETKEDAVANQKVEEDVVANQMVVEKDDEVGVEIEPKTGVSFPVKLEDGKQLNSVGMRKKSVLGLGVKIYGFGMYADNQNLKELLKLKIGKAPAKATKEMYQAVVDSDVGMMIRLVIVFGSLTMNMVKRNFDEGLGASIKKLNGGRKNEELTSKVLGAASDNIKLNSGSVIEISRLPGYILETKVKGEVVSRAENELLCRAYIHMYLGDDPFDKEAKERFGASLLSLF